MFSRVWPGHPYPLGATWDGSGVNFALYSENATKVELCLFDSAEARAESVRIALPSVTNQVWHCYLPDAKPGQLYGYRVHGPDAPHKGYRFNAHKVVLDPYAKGIGRNLHWDDAVYGYRLGAENVIGFDTRDSAPFAPLACVIETAFTWGDDHPLRIPWHDTVVYETHVKGFTKRHPDVPEELRGTYAGLASPAAIQYLRDLGVTAVELLPIHYHIDEHFLIEKGLVNYWGYNTLGYFAPDPRYAANGPQRAAQEFKSMVRTLHTEGFEVMLDVVYNHTAEADHRGPTLSMRGIDNVAYYRLTEDRSRYVDFTGCGNSLNVDNPHVLQLIMDSLRYWLLEMHVDGFRFDLASALARERWEMDRLAAFFDIIHQDPVISQTKLIAEPWDLGPGGYQVGNFPVLWTEWNGRYRDCVRRFWKGDGGTVGELASRLSGSSEGNNNGYCQDSPLSWINWELSEEQRELLVFVRRLIHLRRENPVFRRHHFFQGRPIHGFEIKDLYWLTPHGTEMEDSDWGAGHALCLGMGLLGDQILETDEHGRRIIGDSFLILFNADHREIAFRLGGRAQGLNWELVLDTSNLALTGRRLEQLGEYQLQGRTLAVLRPELSPSVSMKSNT